MGFLDRMLSDAIEQSTGFKARKLVRRIGSRRLLAMGGAALAGGMLAQSASRRTQGTGSFGGGARGNVVPPKSSSDLRAQDRRAQDARAQNAPLPPPPAAPAKLPPLPVTATPDNPVPPVPPTPAPTATPPPVPGSDADLAFEAVALRTVVASALADGEIAAQERELLKEHLDGSSLPAAERQQIQSEVLAPASPEELARALPPGEDPTSLVALAIAMMRSDGELCSAERQWLESFAAALSLPATSVREIESELFED